MNLTDAHHIYFVGIKGVAMTALALYAKERGMQVSGSDIKEVFPTDEILALAAISYYVGFSKEHIQKEKPDFVVYTGAHNGRKNEEVEEALALGIPVFAHGQALGLFMEQSQNISVAGCHGKTTTSAMIATIMKISGHDASYAIGCGYIRGLGMPGHYGKDSIFVAEADEYMTDPSFDRTPRFMWQNPQILVVTNIDYDHPDAYENMDAVKNAFRMFQEKQGVNDITIVNADDKESAFLLETGKKTATFGCSKMADLKISDVKYQEGKTVCNFSYQGMREEMTFRVPGKHNVSNAAAASLAALQLGVSWEDIKKGLAIFEGTKRRFEYIGEKNGIAFYDDYAHHPHEIAATLAGVKEWFSNRRIIVIFQPHTFSRTKTLLSSFAKSFSYASVVLIPDIYASARETDTLGMSSKVLVEEIGKHHKDVRYIKDYEGVFSYIKTHGKPNDVVVYMGAGNIYGWGKQMMEEL